MTRPSLLADLVHLTWRGRLSWAYYAIRRRVIAPAPDNVRCWMGAPVGEHVHCPRRANGIWCKRHSTPTHWTENAERIRGSCNMWMGHVAEDDRGDLWVPSGRYKDWYDRRLSLWRPLHWPHYLRSRLTGKLGFIEHA